MFLRIGGLEARQQAALTGDKPTINLAGGVDYANPNPRIFPRQGEWRGSCDLGVNVNWNFLDFGRTKAAAAEASATVLATRERLAEFDTVVAADVRQRMLDVQTAYATVNAARDGIRSAAEARRVLADRFAAGVATSTDVLVAQVPLLEAELSRTRALASVRLAEARLERALGSPDHERYLRASGLGGQGHRRSRVVAPLRIVRGGGQPVVRGEAGGDLRLPGREWRRQVDDHPHAVRVAASLVRHRAGWRHRRQPRSRGSEAPHRLHVAEVLALRGADRRSEHPLLRRHLWSVA